MARLSACGTEAFLAIFGLRDVHQDWWPRPGDLVRPAIDLNLAGVPNGPALVVWRAGGSWGVLWPSEPGPIITASQSP